MIYGAILNENETGIEVTFPDFPDINVKGVALEEVLASAEKKFGDAVNVYLDSDFYAPTPTDLEVIKASASKAGSQVIHFEFDPKRIY